MKKLALVLVFAFVALPAFAQVGIFENSADWTLETVDNVKAAGSADFTNDIYTLEGNGDDIWGNADEGYFIYTTRTGSVSITALLSWLDPGANEWSKMIAMIREKGDAPGSKHFGGQLRGNNYGDQVNATWRTQEDGGSTSAQFFHPKADPADADVAVEATVEGIWVRVTRIAELNLFFCEWSEDGSNWTLGRVEEIEMADEVVVGLAVTNHINDETLAIGEFYNVEITAPPTLPSSGSRAFSQGSFQPGTEIAVSVTVLNPNQAAASTSIEDTVPTGWTVSDISDGGSESGGTVSWNVSVPFGNTTLTYKATAPAAPAAVNSWSGTIGDSNTGGSAVMTLTQEGPEGDQTFDQHADIIENIDNLGGEDFLGSAEYDTESDTYTLAGAGNDIWANADNFHFLYTAVSGDFNIEAKIIHDESERSTSTDAWIKGMLMGRQNLSAGSVNFGNRMRRDGQYSWQMRAAQDGASTSNGDNRVTFSTEGYPAEDYPRLRVERRGDDWSIFYKDELGDGSWVQVQETQSLVMQDPIYVGLAVTAHQLGSIQYTWFKNVTLEVLNPVSDWTLY
ncbi:MAG: hypothetical protein P9L94_04960 [Candidatus Hinthialibacter antarcticus]|nr:hypothetical protein [Candidatus Hinthialibacter antarcticus]